MTATDGLWGGRLTTLGFDTVTHACTLGVVTTLDGSEVHHVIRCSEVSELRFENAILEPWQYAEVTEAHLTTDEAPRTQTLELVLWSEDAGLVIRAASIEIHQVS